MEPVEQLGNRAQKRQRSVPLMLPERLAPSPSCNRRNAILPEPRLAERAVGESPGIMGMAPAQAEGQSQRASGVTQDSPGSVPCWSLEQKAGRGRVGPEAWRLNQLPRRGESFKVARPQS